MFKLNQNLSLKNPNQSQNGDIALQVEFILKFSSPTETKKIRKSKKRLPDSSEESSSEDDNEKLNKAIKAAKKRMYKSEDSSDTDDEVHVNQICHLLTRDRSPDLPSNTLHQNYTITIFWMYPHKTFEENTLPPKLGEDTFPH